MDENGYIVKGTLQLLLNGGSTLKQTVEVINMFIELSFRKGYAAGELDTLRSLGKKHG